MRAKMTKVAFGADHAGFQLKNHLLQLSIDLGIEAIDLGVNGPESVDYPDQAAAVCRAINGGQTDMGLLVCGSGIGVSIAANREKGIRAALCHNSTEAQLARAHNDANVLCLGERLIGTSIAEDIFRVFFTTKFESGRHQKRIDKLG